MDQKMHLAIALVDFESILIATVIIEMCFANPTNKLDTNLNMCY